MTLNLRMVLQADSAAAKAELEAVARGVKGVTLVTEEQTRASRTSTGATDSNTAAKQRNRQATDAMGRSHQMAAGATGNLVAQFNDIGMMLAAGQNPLQLAIQQGAQITQVIGPMGAAGAAGALKAAFIGMLSPINLITVGLIAAGAAAIQWLTGATEDARSFEDAVADLSDRADAYISAAERARAKTAELRGEFGDAAAAARDMFAGIAERELRGLVREIAAASQDLQTQIGIFEGAEYGVGNQKNLADLFDLSIWSSQARTEINSVLIAFEELDGAGTLDQQLVAAQELSLRFKEVAMASGDISAAEDLILGQLDAMVQKLMAAKAEQDGTRESITATVPEATELASRAQAVVAAISSADGSRLVAAFQAAFPVASQLLGMAQGIIDTIGAAGQAAAAQDLLDQMAIEFSPGGQAMLRYGSRTPGGTASQTALGARNRPAPTNTPGNSGGGAAAARDEADALQELIASLEGEIEALRVQDPIQQEMLKHRQALAGATEAERAQVEELIAVREREMQQLTAAQELQQFKEDLVENALDGLIAKGQSLKEVLDQVIISLAKAVVQAAIFGSGPLGSMFGGKGIGALIFGGGMADGGLVHGPGTGTSDSVPTMLSNGEFVVNANATARNRHLLEAINSNGRVPGYAEGGYVGSDQRRLGGRGAMGGDVRISIDLSGARGDREIEALARKGTQAALREYDREALPSSVKRVSSDPRRTG